MPFIAHPAKVDAPDRLLGEARRLLDAESERLADRISCRPGCTACCDHAIYLTSAELRSIAGAVAELPDAQRQTIRLRSRAILDRLAVEAGGLDHKSDGFAQSYFEMREACPLLFDGLCAVREQRPLVCRDYIVSSHPDHCREPHREQFVRIRRKYPVQRGFAEISRRFGESMHLLPAALLEDPPPAPSAPAAQPQPGADLALLLIGRGR